MKLTSVAGRGLYDDAMARNELAFLLGHFNHAFCDAILNGTTSGHIFDLSNYAPYC